MSAHGAGPSEGGQETRCSALSLAAGEHLGATASTAQEWLVLEVPGAWPRDVGGADGLPARARSALAAWRDAEGSRSRRVLFSRRPGRSGEPLSAHVVTAADTSGGIRRIRLRNHDELERVALESDGEPVGSLVLVCGHGSRDGCCAVHGTAVYWALAEAIDSDSLWISSHQGGHRFAANILVLPAGIQLGRVPPSGAAAAVSRALEGVIDLELYRGRTCYSAVAQAAERAIRADCDLSGIHDLQLVEERAGIVRFRVRGGAERVAAVERAEGPCVPASCGAEAEPQPSFVARVLA